ncbi:hypothetical protein CesoFtcFv8_023367 [Champsocephalus esox]|uniref:Uncharacterized protein n=1 Tax=Champsocephalus esox TaxID=159716 RepID=A0AAN8GJW6_9TELE|nr:hypothetical protein CesoFtcFv8_023367 [Champsocephalus esox]
MGRIWHVAAAPCIASGARSEKWVLRSFSGRLGNRNNFKHSGRNSHTKITELLTYGSPTRFLLAAGKPSNKSAGTEEGEEAAGLVRWQSSVTGRAGEEWREDGRWRCL